MTEPSTPTSFALLSPCGFGNLGDAATMQAAIDNLRRRVPQARFHGVTLWPPDTEQRHGIPSYPLSRAAYKRPFAAPLRAEGTNAAPALAAPSAAGRRRALSLARAVARKLLPRGWPWIVRTEMEQIAGAYRLLRGLDMIVLSGGGQLDEFHGGPWGQPYALAKWALLARLTGTRLVILCTGYGSLDSAVSRWFARLALRLADYRSFRDTGSRQLMRKAGFWRTEDRVLPDLAFSLDVGRHARAADGAAGARRVCVSPMVYCDPERWPRKDEAAYRRYLGELTEAAALLLLSGDEVVLLASDGPDQHTVGELRARLALRLPAGCLERLSAPEVTTVDGFLAQVSQSRLLVASRLHGVVLSHLVATPVVALAYDRKVTAHMQLVEQLPYCLGIDEFTAADIVAAAARLEGAMARERAALRRKAEEFRSALDEQYDAVLRGPRVRPKAGWTASQPPG
jgi:polysaccharide pyruvyl transferase WcaK-like protein